MFVPNYTIESSASQLYRLESFRNALFSELRNSQSVHRQSVFGVCLGLLQENGKMSKYRALLIHYNASIVDSGRIHSACRRTFVSEKVD